MIDIHCHILPDFDDGSSSLEESLMMARMAVDSGVTAIVSTPHFPGRASALRRVEDLYGKYQLLRDALSREHIDLKLLPGAEILCLPETPGLARKKALPTIGNTDYFLVEFYFNESAGYMNQMLHDLAECGYKPVVAHPERYKAVQQDPALVDYWFSTGYVMQLNKGSLLGSFGPWVQAAADGIIHRGLAHVIASDAHGTSMRTPHMAGLAHWLRGHCDPEYAEILTRLNPQRILENQDMVPVR